MLKTIINTCDYIGCMIILSILYYNREIIRNMFTEEVSQINEYTNIDNLSRGNELTIGEECSIADEFVMVEPTDNPSRLAIKRLRQKQLISRIGNERYSEIRRMFTNTPMPNNLCYNRPIDQEDELYDKINYYMKSELGYQGLGV